MPSEMEIQRLLEERMAALLEHANYQSVATALNVSRTAVWRWSRGEAVTPGALARVQSLLRPDLPPFTTKEAASLITRRLLAGVVALETKAEVTPAELATAQDSAELIEAALEADARLAAELEASRRKSAGRAAGQGASPGGGSPSSKRRAP
jgi:hypothetical protein